MSDIDRAKLDRAKAAVGTWDPIAELQAAVRMCRRDVRADQWVERDGLMVALDSNGQEIAWCSHEAYERLVAVAAPHGPNRQT